MTADTFILWEILFINAAAFFVYGLDKWRAVRGLWRISEVSLLLLALVGGSVGAFLAMQIFRHKTRHALFQFGVPLIFLFQAALVIYIYLW